MAERDSVSPLQQAVQEATEGTPYVVYDTEDGFDVELRLSDEHWWGVFEQAGLSETFRWRVREDGDSFSITDETVSVSWSARGPQVGASMSTQMGRIVSLSRRNVWALSDSGRIEPVAAYGFDSREGRDVIRLAARRLGLRERRPWQVTWAAVFAALGVLGPAISWLVYGIYRLFEAHP